MNKRSWALAVATAAYSYLFYSQNAGINFLLFTIGIIGLLAWMRPASVKEKSWLAAAACALFASFFVFVHASWLALLANAISLLALAGATLNGRSSVLMNLLSSGGSIAASPAFLAEDIYLQTSQPKTEKNFLPGLLVWLVPILLAVVFFAIYRSANPLFADFTKVINLDFLTLRWAMFTLGGVLVCSGLVRARRFAKVDDWESRLHGVETQASTVWNEKKAATLLFVLLNVMLLVMNGLDLHYLYFGAGLPEGITHKQFVHNGVGNLIWSIVLGISVVLYFFRGSLNFGNNRLLKFLVYAWIAQNLFMVLSTSLRNEMYIREALITYKRIGVFFWTGMAAAGLVTAAYKIYAKKHAWFLIRTNSAIALAVLTVASAVDWDRFVTEYNLARIRHTADLDKRYLISLSPTNIRHLYGIADHEGFEQNIYYHYEYSAAYGNREKLDRKLAGYLVRVHGTDWRSYSLRQRRVLRDISELDRSGMIGTLNLDGLEIRSLAPFENLTGIKKVILPKNFRMTGESVAILNGFTKLEELVVPKLAFTDLVYFSRLKGIRVAEIRELDELALTFLRQKMPGTEFKVGRISSDGEKRG